MEKVVSPRERQITESLGVRGWAHLDAVILAALAMESRVRFAKLNTDEAQDIGARYDIRSIPTMILFRDGEEVARHSGAMMTGEIQQWVENQLAA